jgi:Flp pilus assembly pilin Flp
VIIIAVTAVGRELRTTFQTVETALIGANAGS